MNSLKVSEHHCSNLATLKKQIEIWKEEAVRKNSDKITSFELYWFNNIALSSVTISYPQFRIYGLQVTGKITIEESNIIILIDNIPPLFLYFRNPIEKKIKDEIKNILGIQVSPVVFKRKLRRFKRL